MRYRLRNLTPDLLITLLLLVLPLLLFWGQTLGGGTLLPAENLYQYEPYATYREVVRAPEIPQNALLSDLVLQNIHWKTFIRQSLAQGEVPLWNPHQLGGVPFMAAGQPSTLYPLNVLYYVLPLESAYGWFTVVNLWLAGVAMYGYVRGLRLKRPSALIAALTYQLSGFFVASAVFPMMLGGVVWLPVLLLMVEYILRARTLFGLPSVIPWVVGGALALGMNILAGHVEITYYTILITAYYGAVRGVHGYWQVRRTPNAVRTWSAKLFAMLSMGILGMALGAVQFIPLYELVSTNWRADGKTFQETLGFAHPARDVLQFAMPNFYGSPAQHTQLDVFSGQRQPVDFINVLGQRKTNTEWGIKNYVEGALYVGILPLVLALYALAERLWGKDNTRLRGCPPYRTLYAVLALIALTFMFGLPTYALVYYGLPGLNQSHTPFRWVYALTLSVAVLAAYGMDGFLEMRSLWIKRAFSLVLGAISALTLAGLALTWMMWARFEGFFGQLLNSLAKANEAFPDARAFYSHIFVNALTFALVTGASALVLYLLTQALHRVRQRSTFEARLAARINGGAWWRQYFPPSLTEFGVMSAVMLVAMDLMMATGGFNPVSDPALLKFTPPAIEWLQGNSDGWRYLTLDDPTQRPLMQPNMTWRYGLDDVRGYESIIPKPYVDTLQALYPQVQLDFNRIAPLYTSYPQGIDFDARDALTADRLHLLNVRYVVTHLTTDLSDVDGYTLAYSDEAVHIWQNANAMPRAYTVPAALPLDADRVPAEYTPAEILSDSGRVLFIALPTATDGAAQQLVVSQSYFDGWRAYLQTDDGETPLMVSRVQGNFTGVALPTDAAGVVRLVYSPQSFQVGAFGSVIAGLLCLFLVAVWFWRQFVVAKDTQGKALLARNSVAPVLLNLFNRAIDFVLAFVVLRVLGPSDAGVYYYAVIVFVWFDIFTNFGLDVFLTREVSRDRSKAGYLFVNTTAFRLLLSLVGVGLLLVFIFVRQNTIATPFDTRGIIALVLLYMGLIPGSLSKGMTSLYYAYERAEYPAAVSTITTLTKAVFQVIVLLLGYGIIGMAGVSIANNFITLAILLIAGRDMLGKLALRPNPALIGGMARESYPLMLNHFLATIFFQIDVVILEALRGAAIVGKYSVGYRWLLALNVIPAFFTMAIFPRMSRHAQEDRALLHRNTVLAYKLLAAIVFPAAVLLTALARPLTLLLGGQEFLPEGAIALQVMVWSMPIGWMNSLTQYLLIALNKQRQITRAFVAGVAFNIVTNLIFIPMYGYVAAAVTTILSELILMVGFGWLLRSELAPIRWLNILWKPALAGAVMALILWVPLPMVLGVLLSVLVYPLVWVGLRPLSAEELQTLAPLMPSPLRVRLVGAAPVAAS